MVPLLRSKKVPGGLKLRSCRTIEDTLVLMAEGLPLKLLSRRLKNLRRLIIKPKEMLPFNKNCGICRQLTLEGRHLFTSQNGSPKNLAAPKYI
jgi:hypothetical protein